MKVAIYSLGCKVNTYESMSVKEQFEHRGYEIVDIKEYADIYVINTCTVTNTADSKSRKMIRRVVRQNPEAIVAVMGCYAQMDPEGVSAIDGVDIVIGTTHRNELINHIEDIIPERKRLALVEDVSNLEVEWNTNCVGNNSNAPNDNLDNL